MSNTPYLNAILEDALTRATPDSAEEGQAEGALKELEGLKEHIEALKKSHEGTSKALYELQFVTHENLINKYCEAKKDLKALLAKMG